MTQSRLSLATLSFLAVALLMSAPGVYAQTPGSMTTPDDGSVLPFPPTPLNDGVARPRYQADRANAPLQ
jgi:hypothetical protein